MNTFMKIGLIAGGAALFFKDKLAEMFSGTTATQQTATAGQAAQQQMQYTQQQAIPAIYLDPRWSQPAAAPPPNPAAVNAAPVTDDLIKKASWDYNTAVILADRVRFNVHQWNFYREHSGEGRANPGTDLGAYGDPNQPITALEYIQRCRAAGVGLTGIHAAQWFYRQ